MKKFWYRSFGLLTLLSVALTLCLSAYLNAQSSSKKKKRKDFGSSLRQLKWDPETKQTSASNLTETGPATPDEDVIRVETSLVATDLLVLNRQGKVVQGLVAADFSITEDGVPQQVGHFLLGGNTTVPRSIVLLIDYSGSQFAYIRDSVEAAKVLVDKLGRNDRMAIVTDDIEMLVDFTNDKRELKQNLDSLVERSKGSDGFLGIGGTRRKFGNSAQYSALMATLKEAFDEEDQRPIIIFQTDGDEATYMRDSIVKPAVPEGLPLELVAQVQEEVEQLKKLQRDGLTEFSLADVSREVEKSRATVYTVIPGPRLIGLSLEQQAQIVKREDERAVAEMLPTLSKKTREAFEERAEARKKFVPLAVLQMRAEESGRVQEALAGLAPLTGGWTEFLETPSQAQSIYSRILSDINQRYIIGYYPTNKARDGKRRKMTFEVKGHPEYTIQSRKSYLAPGK